MKVVAIYGSHRKGSTYHMAREVIDRLAPAEELALTEYFLPRDFPQPCTGCFSCIANGEETCPHRSSLQPILEALDAADVVVLSSATYVYDVTGQMKAFLDHLAYRWMLHRPCAPMFRKVGLAVTSSAGGGHRRACQTLRISMRYWGVARSYPFAEAVRAASWEGIGAKKKAVLLKKADRLAGRIRAQAGKDVRPGFQVRALFLVMGRLVRMLASKTGGRDADYWKEQGWQNGGKPWKN